MRHKAEHVTTLYMSRKNQIKIPYNSLLPQVPVTCLIDNFHSYPASVQIDGLAFNSPANCWHNFKSTITSHNNSNGEDSGKKYKRA